MTRIYTLSLDSNVFYVGQTSMFLCDRLKAHLRAHPELKCLPDWIKICIVINEIEQCHPDSALKRERHWIRHYKSQGHVLINKKIYNQKESKPKHAYKILSLDEIRIIYSHNYQHIAYHLGIHSETLRISLQKKRIKKQYFDAIFNELIPHFQSLNSNKQH